MDSAHLFDSTPNGDCLAVAFELSGASWKIGVHDGKHDKPTVLTVSEDTPEARLAHAVAVIAETKAKWGLPADWPVAVCYEAGQDGFWICRALRKLGCAAMVIDPASVPVGRQGKRAKTDRLDAIMLVNCLRGWLRGERDRLRPIQVPSVDVVADRQLVRDRGELQKEIAQHRDRIRKLLRAEGCWMPVTADFKERLTNGMITGFAGAALPERLRERLSRECERWALAERQLAALEKALVKQLPDKAQERITRLARLRAVGSVGATRLVLELFWRNFDNRRQVGSCVGLVPQPYDSGSSRIDQGISKQGNRRVRALLIELAWLWLRYQPDSALAQWFAKRTGGTGPNKRGKRIAIVALARRLVIALWRYLEQGVVPDGATLKAA